MELVIHELIFCKLIRSNVTVFDAVSIPRYNVNVNRLIRPPFNGSFNGRCKHNTAFRDSRVISQIGCYTRQLLTSPPLLFPVYHRFPFTFIFFHQIFHSVVQKEIKRKKERSLYIQQSHHTLRRRRKEANEAERLSRCDSSREECLIIQCQ